MNKKILSQQELENKLSDYIAGVTEPEISAQIEALAESNNEFASLLLFERELIKSMNQPQEYSPSRAVEHNFTRLKARIKEEQKHIPIYQKLFDAFKKPLPAMFAVACAILITVSIQSPSNNEFVTLSDPDTQVANPENLELLRIIFSTEHNAKDIVEFEKRYALKTIKGPDSAGSYVFALDKEKASDTLIATLQKDPSITFVGKTVTQ